MVSTMTGDCYSLRHLKVQAHRVWGLEDSDLRLPTCDQIRGTLLGGPIVRIMAVMGLHWGPPSLANSHIRIAHGARLCL